MHQCVENRIRDLRQTGKKWQLRIAMNHVIYDLIDTLESQNTRVCVCVFMRSFSWYFLQLLTMPSQKSTKQWTKRRRTTTWTLSLEKPRVNLLLSPSIRPYRRRRNRRWMKLHEWEVFLLCRYESGMVPDRKGWGLRWTSDTHGYD